MTIWIFKEGEIEMSKKLIVAMALSLVLVSGGLFSAQADCGLNPCGWHLNLNPCGWHLPSCFSCSAAATVRPDADIANYDEMVGPNMGTGSPGYPWFRGK
jgi:hypothetical protein